MTKRSERKCLHHCVCARFKKGTLVGAEYAYFGAVVSLPLHCRLVVVVIGSNSTFGSQGLF